MSRLGWTVSAVFTIAACKPESARRADRAAKDVVEQREDVVEATKRSASVEEVLEEAGELVQAANAFEWQRSRRIMELRMEHDLTASQAGVIGVLARDLPITDAARGEINEKLSRLHSRLDEATNLIEGLARVGVDTWEQRDDAATEAMKRLRAARKDAWEALDDAPQIDRSAS